MIRTPRLLANRYGVFSVRIVISAAQSGTGKRRELRHSLGTKNPAIARVLALQFNLHFEQARMSTKKLDLDAFNEIISRPYRLDIKEGVMEASDAADHERMMEAVRLYREIHGTTPPLQEAMQFRAGDSFSNPEQAINRLPKSLLLSKAIEQYLHEKRHGNEASTLAEKKSGLAKYLAYAGDMELNHITKEKIRHWKAKLDGTGNQGAITINKKISFLTDLFRWAINNGHYHHPANPCEGLRIVQSKSTTSEHYLPFSNDDISKIFGKDYKAFMSSAHDYWIPLMGLYSGRRIEALASLTTSNVREVDGVLSFVIIKDKNRAGQGIVPVHPRLIELGFREYLDGLNAKGEAQLFPKLKGAKLSKNTSRNFGLLLDEVGISDPLKVFHSFRHSVITRLHAARGNTAHVMQLVGHAQSKSDVHFGTYTHSISPVELLETLKLLKYPTETLSGYEEKTVTKG
jgi:integrase